MPVPFANKYGTKIVHNPKLCQQLGVFSKTDSIVINDQFYDFLVKNFAVRYYTFNDTNTFSRPLVKRNNFLIFPEKYETVRQKYSPKRKRKLRLDQEIIDDSETIKNPDFGLIKSFILKTGLGADEKNLLDFINLLEDFHHQNKLDFYGFFYHQKLINLIAIYKEEYSLALLGTFNDKEFVKISGSSFLIDKVISENIEDKIFDFEGSEVPSIEEFFRGFRPELKPYFCIQKSKLEIIIKILKTFFSKN